QHDPRLGGPRPVPVAPGRVDRDAVARPRGHVGRGGRHDHHLPRRAHQRPARALRRVRGGRRGSVAQDLARHAARAARRPVHHAHPPGDRHGAGLPRALPVHRRRAEQRDAHRAAAHLPLRLPEQPRRRLRGGDRAVAHARGRPRGVLARLLPAHPVLEHVMTLSPTDNPSEIGVVSQDSAATTDVADDAAGTARRAAEASRRRREAERRTARARRRKALDGVEDRGALSEADWRRPSVRWGMGTTHVLLLVVLVVAGLGPMLLLAKYAVTPTQDILRTPMAVFPNGIAWDNLDRAWNDVQVSRYFLNTIWLAVGSWASQILVATTGGYALSVLRPRYGKVVQALVLSTMFVPAIVLLVPLYLTILDPPLLGRSLINSFWAVWLPAGASAFNVLLVQRFFDSLPREVFEAARMDG